MFWQREGRESPHLRPNLRPQASPKPSGLGTAPGRQALWREGSSSSPNSRPRARERRQRVLNLRLLSWDHPSAPPRTLGPDCPPPAQVSPDRISVGRGRTAALHPLLGEGRVGHRRSRPESSLGPLPLFQSPALASEVNEGDARNGGGRGGTQNTEGCREGS